MNSKNGLLFLLLIVSNFVSGAEYLSHKQTNDRLVLETSEGVVTLSAYGADAFEVVYAPKSVKQLPSFVKSESATHTELNVKSDTSSSLVADAGRLKAIIHKSPFRIEYLRDSQRLVEEELGLFSHDTLRGFRFRLDADEKLMGAGERVVGMDRRGHRLPLYNRAHYGYETQSEQMYFSLPMVLSDKKYMLVFDNSAKGFMDLGKSEKNVLQFEAVGGRTAYWIVAGDNYQQVIGEYTALSGRQPMPPRWALGSIASRFGYHTEAEVRDVVSRYKALEIPLDAVVLDLYWFGADIKGHMGNLEWDRKAFPNPEKMIADLKRDGVNTVVITEPFVLSSSSKWQDAIDQKVLAKNLQGDAKQFDFYFGNTGLIDVFDESSAQWFWQSYQMLLEMGVEGLWGDLGEPEVHPSDTMHYLSKTNQVVSADEIHNAYGHAWAEMVYKNSRRDYPNKRPMIMMRSGFAGSQRYGMIPWTGDVSRSWGGLQSQVELSLQMGTMGLGYIHSDIGGFAGGESFDAELYTRWLQFGAFQPVFRPHGQEEIPSEPVFHDEKTIAIAKRYIDLRYRLLPYLYTLAWENHSQGLPLARPLMFENQDDFWFDNTQSFLWGDSFLVAPVVEPGVSSMSVALPKGVWFDFWSDRRFEALDDVSEFDMATPIETIPVLVKAGALVPMLSDSLMSTKNYDTRAIELHYYADQSSANSRANFYHDDGRSPGAYKNKAYKLLAFEATRKNETLTIEVSSSNTSFKNSESDRAISLVIHNWPSKVNAVSVNGEPVSKADYQRRGNQLFVNVAWSKHQSIAIDVK